MSEGLKADAKIPSVLNLAQAAAGAFYFETSLLCRYQENELRATSLSFSCVLKTTFSFVINRLFYDACFAEKSQDLIFPQDSISFGSIGFYNTFRFSSLRSRDFVTEEMVDILGNHCTGCKG